MNSKKWPTLRKEQGVQICLVHVEIGAASEPYDQFTALVLKQAKDVLKDALVTSAEGHGGKLSSWEDDSGTFMFLAAGPDGCTNCCLAAMKMLDQLPFVQRKVQLSDELGRLLTIRIVCDTCQFGPDPETHNLAEEFLETFKKHGHAVSAGNKVTITERIFRQLDEPLKSRFVKWKHSTELGIDCYATTANTPVRLVPVPAELPAEEEAAAEERAPQDAGMPISARKRAPVRGWREVMSGALESRKLLGVAAVAVLALLIVAILRFRPTSPPPSLGLELVQTEDWRSWRKQIHEKLSTGKVTESMLAGALNIKLPARPEHAAEALRRDQAIADVLLSYPDVRDILKKRFGIYHDTFLGTGLSKPFKELNYGAASVHEYLIKNHFADSKAIWTRTLDPNSKDMEKTVEELFEKEPNPDPNKKELKDAIDQRVKEKGTAFPAVVRFARFNAVDYSRRLGHKDRRYVFASNLAAVWNTRIRDAADLSGYISETGDTVYLWIFLPGHASDVVPATWDQVLTHLPTWLSEIDKD